MDQAVGPGGAALPSQLELHLPGLQPGLHAVYLGYIWYSNVNIIKTITPTIFFVYAALAMSLPISAYLQFRHFLKDKEMLANRGNTIDTVYSNFFIQFQLLFIVCRTIDGYPRFLCNPYFDFVLGVVVPQILYRRFRPEHRGGARDVTSDAYNEKQIKEMLRDEKTTKEELAQIKKWQASSSTYQSFGFCALKWLFVSLNYVLIYCRGYANVPEPMIRFMQEFCLVMSFYQPIYPFLYTLKFRRVIRTEYTYWKVWNYMDVATKVSAAFLGLSLVLKNFVQAPISQFPFALFGSYFALAAIGFVVNIKYAKKQDHFMVLVFVAALVLGWAFPYGRSAAPAAAELPPPPPALTPG